MENSQDYRVSDRKNFYPYKSDKTKQKKTCCMRIKGFLRLISLGEYRTPMYFSNSGSYKSAAGGILTILSGLILAISFIYIFLPIISKKNFNSETKQIRIIGASSDGTE